MRFEARRRFDEGRARSLALPGGGVGPALAAVIAALIQFQPTVRLLGQETRLAASDPIVGLVALAAAAAMLGGRIPLRIWRGHWVWHAVVAMTLVLGVSFAIGYVEIGELSAWAVQNRIFGWVILLGYFLGGGFLRYRYGPGAGDAFFGSFVVVGSAICAVGIGADLLVSLNVSRWLPFGDAQLRGLVANPNAFGLLAALALIAACIVPLHAAERIRGALVGTWAAAAYLSFSRATWLACAVAVAGLFALKRLTWRKAFAWIVVPAAAAAFVISVGRLGPLVASKVDAVVEAKGPRSDTGIADRVRLAEAAIQLWRSSPILGAGLGVHWHREQALHKERPLLLHSTPLWLLAETGVVGISVFGAFALYALLLWLGARRAGSGDCRIEETAVVFLFAFLVMSLFHALLYQRIVWIVLGIALASPLGPRPGGETAGRLEH